MLLLLLYPIFYKMRIKADGLSWEKTGFVIKVRVLSIFLVLEIRKKNENIESFLRLFRWKLKTFTEAGFDKEKEKKELAKKAEGKSEEREMEELSNKKQDEALMEEQRHRTEDSQTDSEERECFLMRVYQGIKEKITAFIEKIKSLKTKKERLQKLYETESCKRALEKIRRRLPKLLKHLFPKKTAGSIRMGLESCDRTGMIFGYYSVISSYVSHNIEVYPDFEQEIFQGEIVLKGRIVLMYLLVEALGLLMNKDVRLTYRRLKKINGR